MPKRLSPFSFYDFLGYFIPGAITLYFVIFACFHSSNHQSIILAASETLTLFKKDFYIPFILISYILGHMLSFLSSVTIEKYANWAYGYPSKYLLGIDPDGYFNPPINKKRRIAGRILIAALILPVTFMDIIFGYIFDWRGLYVKSAGDLSIKIIKESITKIYRDINDIEGLGHSRFFKEQSFFRFCYHYALENAENHNVKMQNYVALFGFTMTLTIIFVLFFWLFLIHYFVGNIDNKLATILLAINGNVSFIFLYGI